MVELVETVLWLCAISSPTGEEGPLCDEIAHRLDVSRPKLTSRRYGNSLVVDRSSNPGRPRIVLAGHLDTVRTTQDGPVRREGDRIYGLGASDMKSGLALMIQLAECDWLDQTGVGVTFVFYAGEEGPYESNELENVLARDPSLQPDSVDLAICLEPSDNALQLGCMGTLHAEVTFEGRSAHSARPWQGQNAILLGWPVLRDLEARTPTPTVVEGLTYTSVMTVTVARGGEVRNVVPESFWININCRFPPPMSVVEATREVERVVDGRGRVEVVDAAPSAAPHRDHPLVEALIASGVRDVQAKQAWTDVGRFSIRGIPAVNFGPGVQDQAHQRNEWTSIPQLDEGKQILHRWLKGGV